VGHKPGLDEVERRKFLNLPGHFKGRRNGKLSYFDDTRSSFWQKCVEERVKRWEVKMVLQGTVTCYEHRSKLNKGFTMYKWVIIIIIIILLFFVINSVPTAERTLLLFRSQVLIARKIKVIFCDMMPSRSQSAIAFINRFFIAASTANVPLPFNSRTVYFLSYQLLTASAHNDWLTGLAYNISARTA
jgi:hypothetical protein